MKIRTIIFPITYTGDVFDEKVNAEVEKLESQGFAIFDVNVQTRPDKLIAVIKYGHRKPGLNFESFNKFVKDFAGNNPNAAERPYEVPLPESDGLTAI